MVTEPKITTACHLKPIRSGGKAIAFGRGAHEIERLGSDGEEERRNFDGKHDSVEEGGGSITVLCEWTQLEL